MMLRRTALLVMRFGLAKAHGIALGQGWIHVRCRRRRRRRCFGFLLLSSLLFLKTAFLFLNLGLELGQFLILLVRLLLVRLLGIILL